MRKHLALAGLVMLAAAPARAESARQSIDAVNAKFEAAFNSGDAAAAGALYAKDAALLPPAEGRVDSRAAIQRYWQGAIDAGYKDFTVKALEVVPTQDGAVEVGRWSIAEPGAARAAGNYMVIWHHAKGGPWQLFRDMWNEDAPAGKT